MCLNRSRPEVTRRLRLAILLVIGTFAVSCGAAIAVKWNRATTPGITVPDSWESAHIWWQEGRCNDCHQPAKGGEIVAAEGISRKPRSHLDPFWHEKHGRSEHSSESRCFICHSQDTCQTCHNHPPDTHVQDFMHPSGNSKAALRHILLSRARPSSCVVCHKDFVTTCSKCHGANEVFDWYKHGESGLSNWPSLLKSIKSQTSDQDSAP